MKFLSKKEVCAKVGLSRAHIDRLEKADDFPIRVKLGGYHNSRVVWVENEVIEWKELRLSLRNEGCHKLHLVKQVTSDEK